jgi:hypothetical protein
MAEVILMPRLSDTMTEGVIAAWHKRIGEHIKKGDLLAEIETDKATMELESYHEGFLLLVGATEGGKLQVNELLAIIGNAGEDLTNILLEYEKDRETFQVKHELPVAIEFCLPDQLLNLKSKSNITHYEIKHWYKKEGENFITGDTLFDIVINEKLYKIGVNVSGRLNHILKSGLYNDWRYYVIKREAICEVECLLSNLPPERLLILDSFFYFKGLEEHPYLKYSKVQLDLYERFLDIELKAIQISLSEVEINDSSLKQQSLIRKEKEKEEKEKEYRQWLIFIILSPFIIYFIIRLFNFNVSEIFITGIFSASILAIGISKKN